MISEITFVLKDGSEHVFSAESHGADFEVLASQFSDGNNEVVERKEVNITESAPVDDAAPATPDAESTKSPVEVVAEVAPVEEVS